MTFSILHTSARPEKWREVYDAWIAAADHHEDVEYVLCYDERWGFVRSELESWAYYIESRCILQNRLVENTHRKCYVDGVNLAAKHATGDILIVNADDQYPCPHWDTVLSQSILAQTIDPAYAHCVVWAPTGTPDEFNRRMMPMPILSRRRYLDLGYVFYPAYESMYADNDFCEQALHDQEQSLFFMLDSDAVSYVSIKLVSSPTATPSSHPACRWTPPTKHRTGRRHTTPERRYSPKGDRTGSPTWICRPSPPLPPLLPSPPLHSPGVNSPFVSVASASPSLGFHVYSK